MQEENVYFKSKNLNLDYFLTLGHRRVRELAVKKLELWMCKIKVRRKGPLL